MIIRVLVVVLLLFTVCIASAKDYYVDARNGKDSNSGRTEQKAWATLWKVNNSDFKPGDRILFRAGTKYHGQLVLKSSGKAEDPIAVGVYGDGPKPQIHGRGWRDYTLLLESVEYVEVRDLEITNMGAERKPRRSGVVVRALNSGEMHHIVLENLTIHHVNGSLVKKEGGGRAIHVEVLRDKVPTRFVDFRILDNHIYDTSRNAIGFGYGEIGNRTKWFPHLQVVIRGNLIEQVPGDGIVVTGSDSALIEGNLLRDFPDILPVGEAAAGIWPWSSDNTVIQFNEVSGHRAKWDGQGYDSDWNSVGTIIQNNYSHDNYGGFLLVCNKGETYGEDRNIGTRGTIIRNNVSFNDGIRPYPARNKKVFSPTFHLTGPIEDTQIYGNVIIVPKKNNEVDDTLIQMDNWGGPWPINTLFEDNEFYIEGRARVNLNEVTDIVFRNNRIHGIVENLDGPENDFESGLPATLKQIRKQALVEKIQKPAQAQAQ